MPKILAIDGRLGNLAILSDLLKNLMPNCAVIIAQSGMEGIEKARAEDPDAILLDIGLPDMDGFEVCRRLTSHESTKHIPVILAMATKTNPDSRIEGLECGANAFLVKPIDEYELVSQVKDALRIRKAEDALRKRSNYLQRMVEERTASLRESEAKFRLLAEESLAGVVIIQDGRFKYVNRAMARMAGYSQEEMLETTVLDLVVEEDRPLVRDNMRRCLDEAMPSVVYDFRCRRPDGLVACFEVLGVRTMFENRLAALSTLIDITDRKQAALQLQDTLDRLKKALSTTIQVMVSAVETRDPYTAGHQLRTADLSQAIATEVGLGPGQIDNIHMVSSIHDIGKLSIPAEILSKPSKLSKIEFAMIKEHAQRGYEILKDVESSWSLAEIVLQHHERMDGSGYPRNLKGEEILIEARILGVADVVESMASHRPYRPSLGSKRALEEIEENAGILYDNTVADACLRLFREKGYELAPQR